MDESRQHKPPSTEPPAHDAPPARPSDPTRQSADDSPFREASLDRIVASDTPPTPLGSDDVRGRPQDQAPPAPDESPFERPEVMTGYPLSPNEQEIVDRLVEEDRKKAVTAHSEREEPESAPGAELEPEPAPPPEDSPFTPPEIDEIVEGDSANDS